MRVTASRRSLLDSCQWWALEGTPWDDSSSKAASAGSLAHAGYEAYHNGKLVELDAAASAKVARARPFIDLLKARGRSWAEMALAYNPADDTARVLGRGRESYKLALPHELTGTADLVVKGENGPEIYDYKANPGPGRTVDAHAQLRLLALMASRAFPRFASIRVAAIVVDETSCGFDCESELDVVDLEEERRALLHRLASIETATPHAGPWCSGRYCPARAQCPEGRKALAEILPRTAGTLAHRFAPAIESAEHAAWLLAHVELVEAAAEAVRAALKAEADRTGGIPLADGTVYRGVDTTSETPILDTPGAMALISAASAESAVSYKTTWTALERALGRKDAAELRKRLREIGAVHETSYKRYSAVKP